MHNELKIGDKVHLKDEFYVFNKLSIAEIPRYSWKFADIEGDAVTIIYDKKGKPFMSMTVNTEFVSRDLI